MNTFLSYLLVFFRDMASYAVVAIFLENTIFSRAIGTSTALYVVRKKYNVFLFGFIMTIITTSSALIAYFLNPFIKDMSHKQYFTPLIYVGVIGIIYIAAVLLSSSFAKKRKDEILSIIHVSTFNCAVLGALILESYVTDLTVGGYIGFGVGTGIGFTFATYLVRLGYRKLSAKSVPSPFRGFPVTLIYIGIVSLALYGLIGHELPF